MSGNVPDRAGTNARGQTLRCIREGMNPSRLTPPAWEGQSYPTGGIFGTRVLIVGESTYAADGKDTSQYNILMATDHIGGLRDAFRTKLIRSFLNTNNEGQHEIAAFWNSVCYLNYIKRPLHGPRRAPTESMWVEFKQPLDKILTELRPNLLVALGYRMWSAWLREPPCRMLLGPIIDGAGRDRSLYFQASDGIHRTLSYSLRHPSSGFSWRKEHPFLMRAIEASKKFQQEKGLSSA